MKNFILTLHIISMCLVVGTLFLQSLIVVFRLRLKKQEEVAGIKNVQKRIHKFIYYPILGVTIISGVVLANTIDIFSQDQNNWISFKLGLLVILIIFGDLLIRTSKLGTILKATGGNLMSAKIAGINTNFVKTTCFLFTSINFGFAGILVMGYSGTTDFSIGMDWILWVIAIAIIGGGSLRGGIGSIFGTFLGVCLIQVIRIGLMNADIQTNAQKIVVGTILIGAATFDSLKIKSKN